MEIAFDASSVKLVGNKYSFQVTDARDIQGAWVALGEGRQIAAFVQNGIPACTIYDAQNKSDLFLVSGDKGLSLQITNGKELKVLSAKELVDLIFAKEEVKTDAAE